MHKEQLDSPSNSPQTKLKIGEISSEILNPKSSNPGFFLFSELSTKKMPWKFDWPAKEKNNWFPFWVHKNTKNANIEPKFSSKIDKKPV